MFPRIRDKR